VCTISAIHGNMRKNRANTRGRSETTDQGTESDKYSLEKIEDASELKGGISVIIGPLEGGLSLTCR